MKYIFKYILRFVCFAVLTVNSLFAIEVFFDENNPSSTMAGDNVVLSGTIALSEEEINQGVGVQEMYLFDNEVYLNLVDIDTVNNAWTVTFENINTGLHSFSVILFDSLGKQTQTEVKHAINVLPLRCKINFHDGDPITQPVGYLNDLGYEFGEHANTVGPGSLYYGWSQPDWEINGFAKNFTGGVSSISAALDSYRLLKSDQGFEPVWELQAPDGLYLVEVWVGDSSYGGEAFAFEIEGISTGQVVTETGADYEGWHSHLTQMVQIRDGRLTIRESNGERITKLNAVHLTQVFAPNEAALKYLSINELGEGDARIRVASLGAQEGFVKPRFALEADLPSHLELMKAIADPWMSNALLVFVDENDQGDLLDYTTELTSGALHWTYTLAGPLAYFGKQFGTSPLLLNTPYSFYLDPGLTGAIASNDSEIRIQVYPKNNPVTLAGTIDLDLDVFFDPSNESGISLQENLNSGLSLEFYDSNFGLKTIVKLSATGTMASPEVLIWHTAETDDYIYVVETNSKASDSSAGSATKILGGTSQSVSLGADAFTPVYAMSFDEWKPAITEVQKQTSAGGTLIPFYLVDGDGSALKKVTKQNLKNAPLVLMNAENVDLATVTDVGDSALDVIRDLPESAASNPASLTPELRIHTLLDEFVEDYQYDPIALTNYVFNEIELVDELGRHEQGDSEIISISYGGVQRSALGVFLEGKGSPVEQCALLIYFLRKCGIPAGYGFSGRNRLLIDDELLSSILRVNIQGYQNVPDDVPVNFPWVVAFIDADGAGGNPGQWVHLFPWIKDIKVTEGFDLFSLMPDNYNTAWEWVNAYLHGEEEVLPFRYNDANETITQYFPGTLPQEYVGLDALIEFDQPMELFPRFVQWKLREQGLSVHLDDLGIQVEYRNRNYSRWQDFPLPTYFNGLVYLQAALIETPEIFDTIQFRLSGVTYDQTTGQELSRSDDLIDSGELFTCDLHNRRVLVDNLIEENGTVNVSLRMGAYDTCLPGSSANYWPVVNAIEDYNTFEAVGNSFESNIINPETSLELHVIHRYSQYKNFDTEVNIEASTITLGYGVTSSEGIAGSMDSRTFEYFESVATGTTALCFNFGSVSREMLSVHADELNRVVTSGGTGTEQLQLDLQYYLFGMQYWAYVSDFDRKFCQLFKVRQMRGFGFLKSGRKQVLNGSDSLYYPYYDLVDAQRNGYLLNGTYDLSKYVRLKDVRNDFDRLRFSQITAFEHCSFYKMFGSPHAVSGIRAFHLAKNRGDSLEIFTYDDWLAYEANPSTSRIGSMMVTHEIDQSTENLTDSDLFNAIQAYFAAGDTRALNTVLYVTPKYYKYEKQTLGDFFSVFELSAVVPLFVETGELGGIIFTNQETGFKFEDSPITSNDSSKGIVLSKQKWNGFSRQYVDLWAIPTAWGYGLKKWEGWIGANNRNVYRHISRGRIIHSNAIFDRRLLPPIVGDTLGTQPLYQARVAINTGSYWWEIDRVGICQMMTNYAYGSTGSTPLPFDFQIKAKHSDADLNLTIQYKRIGVAVYKEKLMLSGGIPAPSVSPVAFEEDYSVSDYYSISEFEFYTKDWATWAEDVPPNQLVDLFIPPLNLPFPYEPPVYPYKFFGALDRARLMQFKVVHDGFLPSTVVYYHKPGGIFSRLHGDGECAFSWQNSWDPTSPFSISIKVLLNDEFLSEGQAEVQLPINMEDVGEINYNMSYSGENEYESSSQDWIYVTEIETTFYKTVKAGFRFLYWEVDGVVQKGNELKVISNRYQNNSTVDVKAVYELDYKN